MSIANEDVRPVNLETLIGCCQKCKQNNDTKCLDLCNQKPIWPTPNYKTIDDPIIKYSDCCKGNGPNPNPELTYFCKTGICFQ